MKIEWLNESYTRARITKGWFRKMQAVVYLYCEGGHWKFEGPNTNLGMWRQETLDSARAKLVGPWKPVPKVPAARVVKR